MAKPDIRLKGFKGEWEYKPFSDIYVHKVIKNDLTYGVDKIISVANMHYNSEASISDINYLKTYNLFEIGDIAFEGHTSKEFAYGRFVENTIGNGIVSHIFDVYKHKETDRYDLNYWKYAINNEKIMKNILVRCTKASTMMHDIIASEFLNESIYIPSYEEQRGIGAFIKSIDNQIQAQEISIFKLKQIKQASLVSMFPQAGETTPRVRFKGFEGEWVVKKLSSIANRVTRKNTHLESTLPLTISAAEGLIEQTSFFNNVVASSNVSGYYLVKKGEFAYNKSYSNGYPFGAVKRLDRFEKGVLSTLYIVFSIDKKVSSDYIVQFFETSLWHQEVAKRAAEGARNHGLLNIGADDFLDINLYLPNSKDEQQRIASYFRSLDKQISLQEKRLEKLKQIKAACLDKMFV